MFKWTVPPAEARRLYLFAEHVAMHRRRFLSLGGVELEPHSPVPVGTPRFGQDVLYIDAIPN
jgi:hypothetical protein